MWAYLLRRILYAIPILIGVNLITFALFFFVNSPNDIARIHLGGKYITQAAKDNWKQTHGYDLPMFYNSSATGTDAVTQTLFFQKSLKLFTFQFGISDTGRDIIQAIQERFLPSILIALPTLFIGLTVDISIALLLVFFNNTYIERMGLFLCVVMISISVLFYIVLGQFLFAKVFRWLPVSGYVDGWYALKFVILPVLIGVIAGMGSGARWYQTLFMEEYHKDYVRTAKAKGLSNIQVLFRHVLQNALIPILTGVVALFPLLFLGSLLMESFFGIPGLGNYTIDAIRLQDFAIVRVMVFIGTILYIVGLIMTDISYVLVDPRVRLK